MVLSPPTHTAHTHPRCPLYDHVGPTRVYPKFIVSKVHILNLMIRIRSSNWFLKLILSNIQRSLIFENEWIAFFVSEGVLELKIWLHIPSQPNDLTMEQPHHGSLSPHHGPYKGIYDQPNALHHGTSKFYISEQCSLSLITRHSGPYQCSTWWINHMIRLIDMMDQLSCLFILVLWYFKTGVVLWCKISSHNIVWKMMNK